MNTDRSEVEAEVFDPTGQGVEVVDAEFARRLMRERNEAREKLTIAERERMETEGWLGVLQMEIAMSGKGGDSISQADQLELLAEAEMVDEFASYAGPDLWRKLAEALLMTRRRVEEFSKAAVQAELEAEDIHDEAECGRALSMELRSEIIRLREIFPKILEALGHEDVCGAGAAVNFLENIPAIVREELKKAQLGWMGGDDFEALSLIAGVVDDYCESSDCTTLDAARLMRCRVQELEARDTRRKIYDSWER